MKLSPRQVDAVASAICGDNATSFAYRTGQQLKRFVAFTGVDVTWLEGGSRFYDMQGFVEAANETPPGRSGLPRGVEQIIEALLDVREFDSPLQQLEGVVDLERALGSLPVTIKAEGDKVELRPRDASPGQEVVEREVVTVFGETLAEAALAPAREHYRKARALFDAAEPDYANTAKEAVCTIESLVKLLTGERDFNRAIEKAIRAGNLPRPLGEMIKKFYGYRGDEPGVAHAGTELPDVSRADALFALHTAASVGLYLRSKLVEGPAPV